MNLFIVTKVELFSDRKLCMQHFPSVFMTLDDARNFINEDMQKFSEEEHRKFRLLNSSSQSYIYIYTYEFVDSDFDFDCIADYSLIHDGIMEYCIWIL